MNKDKISAAIAEALGLDPDDVVAVDLDVETDDHDDPSLSDEDRAIVKDMQISQDEMCDSFDNDEDHSFTVYTVAKSAHGMFHSLVRKVDATPDVSLVNRARIEYIKQGNEATGGKIMKITVEVVPFDDEKEHQN